MKKNVVITIIIILLLFSNNILAQSSLININAVYKYSQFTRDIKIMQQRYPELIKTEKLGKSVDNRDIILLKVGKGKTNVVLWGGLHAREIASTPILMKLIETYCKGYYNNLKIDGYHIKELLDKVTFYIIPLANPDGYVLATEGKDKITNEK